MNSTESKLCFFFQISWLLSKHLLFSILVCLRFCWLCSGWELPHRPQCLPHLPTCCSTSTLCFLLRVLSYVTLCPARLRNIWMLITAPWISKVFPGPLQNCMSINPNTSRMESVSPTSKLYFWQIPQHSSFSWLNSANHMVSIWPGFSKITQILCYLVLLNKINSLWIFYYN